jgi:uncharacterized protein (UPF0303 family)
VSNKIDISYISLHLLKISQINQEIIDERGNFIILDINIQDYRMTLVATYGPNEDNPDFFKKLVFNINQFDNYSNEFLKGTATPLLVLE